MAITDQLVTVAACRPHPRNYNNHGPEQMTVLQESLRQFGQVRAIVVQARQDNLYWLVAGHGVWEAASSLGFTELRASVIPADWPEAKVLAYLTADNEIARQAEPDEAQLAAILKDVHAYDARLAAVAAGSEAQLRELLAFLAAENGAGDAGSGMGEITEDEAAVLQEIWGTEEGQVWEIPSRTRPGACHRLMCGDATAAGDVARLLDGARPLIMTTDPPYGVDYDPAWRQEAAEAGHLAYAARRVGEVTNDTRVDWTEAWALFPGDVVYCWHAGLKAAEVQHSLEAAGFQLRSQIIWSKPHFPISRGHYHWRHEPCWYAVREGGQAHWIGDRAQTTVWEIALDANVAGGHSTQKPVECMARGIRNHEGDVYDPFVGSGTTLEAAEQLGRLAYAMDVAPKYVAVALERAKRLGLEPHLVSEAAPEAKEA